MAEKISPSPAVFSDGSPSEITMAQSQSRVENAAILDESTGYKLLENRKENVAEPEIEYAEHVDELALGMARNSLNGHLKDTDYPTEPGTFDQPITEKPKRFGSDSGKQKRKHLRITKGNDIVRGSEGKITEESIEKHFNESLLKYMLDYNARFSKISVPDNHGDVVVVLEIFPDPDMSEEDEIEFEILSDNDTSSVESETEDAESLYSLEEEMDSEGSMKDVYCDSDDIEYNDQPMTITRYIEDAPFVVVDSGKYEDACIADLPMIASGDY